VHGRIRGALVGVLLIAVSVFAVSQIPEIETLNLSNALYRQHQDGVRAYYRNVSAGEPLPPLLFYRYRPAPDETLFGIAARLAIPYSAIATLNRLDSPTVPENTELLIPSYPGVFLPMTPRSDLDHMMSELRSDAAATIVTIPDSSGPIRFRFFPGGDYLADERRAFLGTLFRMPVANARITSTYGMRVQPLTGMLAFHAGVDFAAVKGTPVSAAAAGSVAEVGVDEVMGNYVLLDHTGGFETFYGHLDTVAVSLNQQVASGMILGTVGDSGATTGAHLHFEIRHDGETRDPLALLP
jgi:murein DD-endopeptidase MepM/ murein hydrolase activator NlpD